MVVALIPTVILIALAWKTSSADLGVEADISAPQVFVAVVQKDITKKKLVPDSETPLDTEIQTIVQEVEVTNKSENDLYLVIDPAKVKGKIKAEVRPNETLDDDTKQKVEAVLKDALEIKHYYKEKNAQGEEVDTEITNTKRPKVSKKDPNNQNKLTVYNKIKLKADKLEGHENLQLFKDSVSKIKIKCEINYKLVEEQQ